MNVRKAAVSGSFYPDLKSDLQHTISILLGSVPDELSEEFRNKEIFGIFAPHAGYIYSGQVAAFAYKLLEGKQFDSIILLSPFHDTFRRFHGAFEGYALSHYDAFETPLGKIPVDVELSEAFIGISKDFFYSNDHHDSEHSIEVQLPFLQTVLKDFKIVPMMIGHQSEESVERLCEALLSVTRKSNQRILVVASGDLSHMHSAEEAEKIDNEFARLLNKGDSKALLNHAVSREMRICGGGPIAALLKLSQKAGNLKHKNLIYMNSGQVTGDTSSVVGYLSGVFYREE